MKPILHVKNLETRFFTNEGAMTAISSLGFKAYSGKTLAIVGESGCGKSVTSLSIMQLIQSPPGKITQGEIFFKERDLLKLSKSDMRKVRGKQIAMIFQEPMTSLNPVLTIEDQISESLILHENMNKVQARERSLELLNLVGIPDPDKCLLDYPHRLSGGMRQRVMIAMAVACNPELIIADEPTTALDVTIQAQVLELLKRLEQKLNAALILITHDLGVVAETADHVMVMYAGYKMEQAPVKELFNDPKHPYTKGLIAATPQINSSSHFRNSRLSEIKGMVPFLLDMPKGCPFAPRCSLAIDVCHEQKPEETHLGPDRSFSCFVAQQAL